MRSVSYVSKGLGKLDVGAGLNLNDECLYNVLAEDALDIISKTNSRRQKKEKEDKSKKDKGEKNQSSSEGWSESQWHDYVYEQALKDLPRNGMLIVLPGNKHQYVNSLKEFEEFCAKNPMLINEGQANVVKSLAHQTTSAKMLESLNFADPGLEIIRRKYNVGDVVACQIGADESYNVVLNLSVKENPRLVYDTEYTVKIMGGQNMPLMRSTEVIDLDGITEENYQNLTKLNVNVTSTFVYEIVGESYNEKLKKFKYEDVEQSIELGDSQETQEKNLLQNYKNSAVVTIMRTLISDTLNENINGKKGKKELISDVLKAIYISAAKNEKHKTFLSKQILFRVADLLTAYDNAIKSEKKEEIEAKTKDAKMTMPIKIFDLLKKMDHDLKMDCEIDLSGSEESRVTNDLQQQQPEQQQPEKIIDSANRLFDCAKVLLITGATTGVSAVVGSVGYCYATSALITVAALTTPVVLTPLVFGSAFIAASIILAAIAMYVEQSHETKNISAASSAQNI